MGNFSGPNDVAYPPVGGTIFIGSPDEQTHALPASEPDLAPKGRPMPKPPKFRRV